MALSGVLQLVAHVGQELGLVAAGGGELLPLLLELLEQAGVLDRQDRLVGQRLHQIDRLGAERAGALAADHQRADQAVLAQERHAEQRPIAGPADGVVKGIARLLIDVGDLDRGPAEPGLAHGALAQAHRPARDRVDDLGVEPVGRLQAKDPGRLVVSAEHAGIRLGQRDRVGGDCAQHRLQRQRGADLAADLAERAQLRDRAGQIARARLHLVEQPRVLDRDHGLIGELLEQLFLGLGHGSSLGPADDDDADRLALAQHRHAQHPVPAHGRGKLLIVVRIGQRVLQSDHRPGEHDPSGDLGRVGPHRVLGPQQLHIARADVVAGDEMEQLAIEAEHVGKQAAAQSDRVAHDRLEHRLHLGRRGADHAQDRRRRRLLLQGLGQVAACAPAPRRTGARSRSR